MSFWVNGLNGIVHPKVEILSSFVHPSVVPDLCDFHSSVEHKRRYLEELFWSIQ